VAAIPVALLLLAYVALALTMRTASDVLKPDPASADVAASKAGAAPALLLADASGITGSPGTADAQQVLVGAAAVQNGSSPAAVVVKEIKFTNITCSVRQQRSWVEAVLGQRKAPDSSTDAAVKLDVEHHGSMAQQHGKQILHGITGVARCGELIGILGPSGGGKSTLLGILTGQLGSDKDWTLGGQVTVDGHVAGPEALARLTAFVPQDDFILRSLTVEECLTYSAVLRLPRETPVSELRSRVGATLSELGLAHVRSSLVWAGSGGSPGVSGGERRRVSIAMELVSGPGVLVIDEPTSGLDSHNALQLLRTLRGVAAHGRLVLMSLHQPSPTLFNMLHTTLVLAKGRAVYYGSPADAPSAFEVLGAPCPVDSSIAEHMLHVVSDQQLWAGIDRMLEMQRKQAEQQLTVVTAGQQGELRAERPGPGPLRELAVVFWRSCADVVRNPMLGTFHAVIGLVSGLLVGCIFFKVRAWHPLLHTHPWHFFMAKGTDARPKGCAYELSELLCIQPESLAWHMLAAQQAGAVAAGAAEASM
jgi:ABC-type multidrug transport system ATPase subunit